MFLLPCEIYHREFDSKLLLSIYLSKYYKLPVLIGYDKHFNQLTPLLRSTLLLDKSCSQVVWQGRIKRVKENLGKAFVLDEEGFFNLSVSPSNSLLRVDRDCASSVDKYFCWGEYDYNFFKVIPQLRSNMVVSGHFRSDLLTSEIGYSFYQDKINSLRTLFGDFILISDSFSVDRRSGVHTLPFLSSDINAQKKAQLRYDKNLEARRKEREYFSDVVEQAVIKYPAKQFILRPHPISDQRWWVNRFWNYRNLHVINLDNIEPWLFACTALLSMGCTTAIQSTLAGKPVIELASPNQSSSSNHKHEILSNFGVDSLATVEECLSRLSNIFNRSQPTVSISSKTLSRYWVNATSPTSCENFLQFMSPEASSFSNLQYNLHVLEKYFNLMSKQPIKLDSNKWIYPSFTSVVSALESASHSIQLSKIPKLQKVASGLYLLSTN